MIARLTGRIVEKEPHQVVVDVGGLGYRASIPLSTYYTLPAAGEQVTLRIHTHVREDLLALYGFSTHEEQELFERLIEISGIGPRLALAILSGLSAADLVEAISDGDSGRLRGVPGVGPKTAERVVLEMRDRVGLLKAALSDGRGETAAGGSVRGDVVSALVNLGYRETEALTAVKKALDGGSEASVGPRADAIQQILKRSLKYLAS